jgi:hypothetical protein
MVESTNLAMIGLVVEAGEASNPGLTSIRASGSLLRKARQGAPSANPNRVHS